MAAVPADGHAHPRTHARPPRRSSPFLTALRGAKYPRARGTWAASHWPPAINALQEPVSYSWICARFGAHALTGVRCSSRYRDDVLHGAVVEAEEQRRGTRFLPRGPARPVESPWRRSRCASTLRSLDDEATGVTKS